MARIRTIKPEFWTHPILASLPDDARLAAIGLLNLADDHGFFLARPAIVRSALWPLDEDSSKARRALAQLSEAGWIEVREHPTHGPIGRVVNFTKHQRVDRPSPSKLETYWIVEDSSNIRRTLDDHSLLEQGTGNREQGTGNREHEHAGASARGAVTPAPLPISASAPIDLPPRLRDAYREILDIDGAEVAGKALSAGRRLFRSPSPAQLLETWKCAAAAGKMTEPADRWPDFRERMRSDQRKDRSPCAVAADDDAMDFARRMDEALLAGSRK